MCTDQARNAQANGALIDQRTELDKIYLQYELSELEKEPGYIPGNYTNMTDNGYVGLLPPMA